MKEMLFFFNLNFYTFYGDFFPYIISLVVFFQATGPVTIFHLSILIKHESCLYVCLFVHVFRGSHSNMQKQAFQNFDFYEVPIWSSVKN